jgi:hypothetical protein
MNCQSLRFEFGPVIPGASGRTCQDTARTAATASAGNFQSPLEQPPATTTRMDPLHLGGNFFPRTKHAGAAAYDALRTANHRGRRGFSAVATPAPPRNARITTHAEDAKIARGMAEASG